MFDINKLQEQLDLARTLGPSQIAVGAADLSVLIAAYKQLQYQNERAKRDVAKVTETDQNPT